MKTKLDLRLENYCPNEKNDDRFTFNLPRDLKAELLKLPARSRNQKLIEVVRVMIKENAS
jgi:hypothetical protein